jgi:GntR family transcriptional regulator
LEVEGLPHKPPPIPLYQRVYSVIYRRVQAGTYPPGSALSTEDQLASEFGVSKATVRQAIGELVNRGLVVRKQGSGTFVREDALIHRPHAFVGSFADLIIGTHEISVRDYTVEDDAPFPPEVLAALGMDGPRGTLLRHHRDIDGTSFAYAVVYLAPLVTSVLAGPELVPAGRASLLKQRGVAITSARQSMSAELADVEVARNLGIEFGEPVLFADRVVQSEQGPVEVVHTWYRGDLYKWEATLSFTWTADGLAISVSADEHPPG